MFLLCRYARPSVMWLQKTRRGSVGMPFTTSSKSLSGVSLRCCCSCLQRAEAEPPVTYSWKIMSTNSLTVSSYEEPKYSTMLRCLHIFITPTSFTKSVTWLPAESSFSTFTVFTATNFPSGRRAVCLLLRHCVGREPFERGRYKGVGAHDLRKPVRCAPPNIHKQTLPKLPLPSSRTV